MTKQENTGRAVSKYYNMVAKIAFSYVKNVQDAEDISQEVFLALLLKKIELKNEDHLKAWLIRVTINRSKNHLKSWWIKHTNSLPDDISYLPKEQYELLSSVLALDEKYRIPIHLYYYEGYSIKESAFILRKPVSTIGTRLSRGRKILKNLIGGNENG